MVCKLLTTKPTTAIPILKHVWDQLYKIPEMRVLMNQYWHKDTHLAQLMLNIGKHKEWKNDLKLLQSINQVKQKYNSLWQACRLADISWTTFHRHTYIKSQPRRQKADIESIQQHYQSDEVSFPLPNKKYHGKRFLRFNLNKCTRMYNMCQDTMRKISAATYHKYKPKTVKLQGRIPFRQSCCERCQNFENILNEASKYMASGDAIDLSMCHYTGFSPDIKCILHICDKCGTSKYKDLILKKKCKQNL